MKISEIVEKLKEEVEKKPIKLYEEGKRQLNDPDEGTVNKAIIKICELWNRDEKSRGFVKHLINSFIPIDPWNRISNFSEEDKRDGKNRCCVLGIKMAGIAEITEGIAAFSTLKMRLDAKAITENRTTRTKAEMKELKDAKMKMPVEVRNSTQAFMSDTSSKLISNEALTGLKIFIEHCLLEGEKEINYIITRKRRKFIKRDTKPVVIQKEQRPVVKKEQRSVKKSTYSLGENFLDQETVDKLKGLMEGN